MTTVMIRNVRLTDVDELGLGCVLVRNGQIESVQNDDNSSKHAADIEIDGNGHILIPGMIDVHIHGAEGFDMMDGTLQSVEAVSTTCARTGLEKSQEL